jgi:uncharacterized protein (DUF1684 family)
MFKNKIIRWSTVAMVIAILAYFFVEILSPPSDANGSVDPQEYAAKITEERGDKDHLFKTSSESPIADKQNFLGLSYYAPDLNYRVRAVVTPFTADDKELKIGYTDGTTDTYQKIGYAVFTIDGQEQKLLLLEHGGSVSLLFRDATSGKETYGGGRYLDFPLSDLKGNTFILDFNKVYNPYCVYSPGYACPLPPAENTLTIPIEAGEKYQSEK